MLVVFLVVDYHAQVLGQLLERLDIVRNELWGAVVVFEQLDNLASDKSVRAAEAEEDGEEQRDNVVYEEVYEGAYGSRSLLVDGPAAPAGCRLLDIAVGG